MKEVISLSYDSIDKDFCQDNILDDEIQSKFTDKKKWSILLSDSYKRLGYIEKAAKVSDCGTFLEFRRPVPNSCAEASASMAELGATSDGWKLQYANFCRDRLCPMCQWRRSYKVFAQVSRVMDQIEDKFIFLFLTLTIPNCSGDDLKSTISKLQKGFDRFSQYAAFKKCVAGYFKALEVTINQKYGTFHPHFHIILAVDNDYFVKHKNPKHDKYVSRDEWLHMWQRAMRDDTITQVDIRRIKPKKDIKTGDVNVKALSAAVAEVAKYSVKSSDYLRKNSKRLSDIYVNHLVNGLGKCRLCSFGGIMQQIRITLNMDDFEDGDLIHINNEELRSDVAYMIRQYRWGCGAYKLINEDLQVNIDIEVNYDEI